MSAERISNQETEVSQEENKWSFESTERSAEEAAGAVEARLAQLGWTEEQLGNFRLAISDAVANAIVHGNEGDLAKKVNVELNIKNEDGEEVAEVTILDEGNGLDPNQIPDPTRDEGLLEGHGRGVYFMRVFTDADPEFFEGQGKVILRRRKNRPVETDTIG